MDTVEQTVTGGLVGQCQAVLKVFLGGLVEHHNAVVLVSAHGHLVASPAAHAQVTVHVEIVLGNQGVDFPQQNLTAHDENVHGSLVIFRCGKVADHVFYFALVVQLEGKVHDLLAVAHAFAGDHGDVPAGSNVGSQNLVQVDVGQHGGVNHHHILVVAEFQEVHVGGQAFQLATIGMVDGRSVGGEEFQTALA